MTGRDRPFRLVALGGDDVARVVNAGLVDLVRERAGETAIVDMIGVDGLAEVAACVETTDWTDVDAAVLSISSAVVDWRAGAFSGHEAAEVLTRALAPVVSSLKQAGTHVLVLNGSTYDPTDTKAPWHRSGASPSLLVHRLALALIELSVLDGVAVVNADRILGELGAAAHVTGLLAYDDAACGALAAETVRVLDEYRMFDVEAPTVPQAGRRTA